MSVSPPPSPAAAPAPRAPAHTEHRQRLLDGLAMALADRPFSEVKIGDIVALAHVSRRTFYEQFPSKEDCLLALGERLSDQTLALIAQNYRFDADWVSQLRAVTAAFLASLAAQPAVLKAVYMDLLTLGGRGLALRRRMGERFGQFLIAQVEVFRMQEPQKRPLSPALATAIIGGVNELILQAIERGEAHRLGELTPTVTAFIEAVIASLESPAPSAD